MKTIKVLIIFIFSCSSLFPQVVLKSESIIKNKYEFTFSNQINYELSKIDNRVIIKFPGFDSGENPGDFILPEKEFFIAIPPYSNPKVNISILKSETIKSNPDVSKIAVYLNDSTLAYKDFPLTLSKEKNNPVKIKGFLWINDSYCINLSVDLFKYNFNERTVSKNTEFSIELIFNQILPQPGLNKANKNGIILNSNFAQLVKSNVPKYKVAATDDWIDYSKDYIKIGTDEDAIYRITPSDFSDFGINPNSIDPKTLKIFYKGNEIPIYVSGENDNSFSGSDFIEFVGQKNYGDKDYREIAAYNTHYKEYLNVYSDTSIYWLTWNGENGKRVDTTVFASGNLNEINYYDELIHTEENLWYDFSLAGGAVRRELPEQLENETWEWWTQGVGTRNFNFTISNLFPDKTAKLFVKLQSWASNISHNSHDLSLKINNFPETYDSGFIDQYEVKILKAEFSSSKLSDGSNTLKVISYPTEASVNSIFGDWYEIEYPRYLRAINDSLKFSFRNIISPVPAQIKISGFSSASGSDNIILYKYFDDNKSIKITNYVWNLDTLIFTDTLSNNDKFLLTNPGKIAKPHFYYKKRFINLRNSAIQADYLLITHPVFIPTADNYINFIEENYNLSGKIINVFDIYDEFNYGFFAPEPIKEFLKAADDFWRLPKPQYVFIVGKANYDFYGYKVKNFGAPEVPNIVPSFGVPVSDVWFTVWDSLDSGIPQLNIGRLPAKNIQEFQYYFDKHKNYLSKGFDDWNKKYLFFSGGNFTDPNQINQLKSQNNFIINNYIEPAPIGGKASHFYKTTDPVTNFGPFSPAQIQSAINEGGVFISYLGHSGTETWDNTITDINQLNNNVDRNPLITDFGCSTGRFAEPDVTSFSELAVNSLDGQAIAYIGNSSLGFTSTSYSFPQIFYQTIFEDSIYNIGEAHKLAKIKLINTYGNSGSYRLFLYTNSLIGDPVINLPIPSLPNFTINSKDFVVSPLIPNDQEDSVDVKFFYYNYGRVPNDSINILVKEEFADSKVFETNFSRKIPLFSDSIAIPVYIKNKAGDHKITIQLDPENKISEITENDNNLNFSFNVASSSVRNINTYPIENQIDGNIIFLNPNINLSKENFILEISYNKEFSNPVTYTIPFDSFYTKYKFDQSFNNSRIWMRSKIEGTNSFGAAQSFFVGNKNDYLLNDSISFSTSKLTNLKILDNKIILDTSHITFSVISAGFNDGKTAVINKNNQNFIPENTLRGAHVCLFEAENYNFAGYRLFDGDQENFTSFLDTLSSKYIVCIAIADNQSFSTGLKNEIKSLGSIYIDSVGFRSSWAIIGRKGAAPGSVPEAFSNPFEGRVQIDTTINLIFKEGNLTTSKIGPAAEWNSLNISQQKSANTKINYKALKIDIEGNTDTVNLALENNSSDLSFIDAKKYPYLIISSYIEINENEPPPQLNSIEVDYAGIPELGTNYQVVSVSNDSVDSGAKNNLNFYVYNAGESSADSFKVKVQIIKPDNSRNEILNENVISLQSEERKLFKADYENKGMGGNYIFHIEIDPENKINELYKDNNFFDIPFYVRGDTTTLSVSPASFTAKYDGVDIMDGEYISNTPNIEMTLNYPVWFPAQDTNAVAFYLDDKKIPYSEFQINFDNSARVNKYIFSPELSDGEHLLKVFGINNLGILESIPGYERSFLVLEEAKILNVYNFPNPFKNDTYFTFKLTQIPDEIKIKIFTIAGRLIKEIEKNSSELNYDFNKIFWNGRDEDGDLIANGVYLYKIIMKKGSKTEDVTQKLAVVR